MPTLTVRRLPDDVHRALKACADVEGISTDEKVITDEKLRRVLAEQVLPARGTGFGDEMNGLVDEFGLTNDGFGPQGPQDDMRPAPFG